ncbi:hypothetical protein [Bacillus pinisoli]|uniref:hypothetical protein n=1 Tax=Bacillus pinisoli TaxID=2901866 RepID=UPI001FF11EED|nr:hypothetical protein [Bacillus pinisoli]
MTEGIRESYLSEELLERYVLLIKQSKAAKEEMDKIKQVFHSYFDEQTGVNCKAEVTVGDYFIQRQIRISESYDEARTVQYLEEENLKECIQLVKRPDEQKIDAAIQLGLLNDKKINELKVSKSTQAISVKKIK